MSRHGAGWDIGNCSSNRVLAGAAAAWRRQPLRRFPQSPIERMTRAGFPPARVFAGTFLVTTEPAATTEFFANIAADSGVLR